MNPRPSTEAEKKEAVELSNIIVKIDNAMKEVKALSDNHQSIKYHQEVNFYVLTELSKIITPNRVMAGRSWTFYMANCTISIKRKFDTQ